MDIEVIRETFESEYTEGKMYLNEEYFCDTLEDTVRILNEYEDKIFGKTAIPMGRYLVELTYSLKFNKVLPEVIGVPYFEGIRIHNGSFPENTEGCILVGEKYKDGMLTNSKKTLSKLMNILNKAVKDGEDIFLSIH